MTENSRDDLSDLNNWNVLVGRVIGHWDRALLKVQPIEASPNRFDAGNQLCIAAKSGRRLFSINHSKKQGHAYILDCGLTSTPEAEALRGAELSIHPSMRPSLPEDEFYFDQLFGMKVVTQDGQSLGEIEEILDTPAHPVYVTPQVMIPGIAPFIISTDWENRILTVNREGLHIED